MNELDYHIKENYEPKDLGIVCPNNKKHTIEWSISVYLCICQECGITFTHNKIKDEKDNKS